MKILYESTRSRLLHDLLCCTTHRDRECHVVQPNTHSPFLKLMSCTAKAALGCVSCHLPLSLLDCRLCWAIDEQMQRIRPALQECAEFQCCQGGENKEQKEIRRKLVKTPDPTKTLGKQLDPAAVSDAHSIHM